MITTSRPRLDYKRLGEGSPLLLIMGMSGTYDHWGEEFLEALARRREVVVYDHRGVGASDPLDGPFSIADLADDALGLADHLSLERFDLLGFSMGGMVAQELVLKEPARVGSLVLASTFAGGKQSVPRSQETADRLQEAIRSGNREAAIRTAWELNVSAQRRDNRSLYRRFLEIGMRRAVPLRTVVAQLAAIEAHDTSGRLGEVKAPTLILHGSEDRMLPAANGELLARLIPGARLQLLEGVGHLFSWEVPGLAASSILDHLEKVR